MIVKEVSVNGNAYKFTLTDQVIGQVDRLKMLYASAPTRIRRVSSR